jgi:hypothetical protein
VNFAFFELVIFYETELIDVIENDDWSFVQLGIFANIQYNLFYVLEFCNNFLCGWTLTVFEADVINLFFLAPVQFHKLFNRG